MYLYEYIIKYRLPMIHAYMRILLQPLGIITHTISYTSKLKATSISINIPEVNSPKFVSAAACSEE